LKKSDQTQTITVKQNAIMNTRPTTCQTTRAHAIPLAILFAFIATAPTLIAQFSLGGLGGAMSIGSGLQGMGMSGMGSAMGQAQGVSNMGGMGGQMGGQMGGMGGQMGGGMMGGGMGGMQRRSMRVGYTPRSGMSITSAAQPAAMRRAPTLGELRRALRLYKRRN